MFRSEKRVQEEKEERITVKNSKKEIFICKNNFFAAIKWFRLTFKQIMRIYNSIEEACLIYLQNIKGTKCYMYKISSSEQTKKLESSTKTKKNYKTTGKNHKCSIKNTIKT